MSDHPRYATGPDNPYGGPAHGGPVARDPRPAPASLAVKLLWAAIALAVIGTVISFVTIDSLTQQMLEDPASQAAGFDSATVRALIVATGVFTLVLIGLLALLTVFIGRGANWARIVFTVLAGLSILFTVLGLAGSAGSQPVVSLLFTLLQTLLLVVALVLLWKPESNAWFSTR